MSYLVVPLLQAFVLLSHYVSDQERPGATRSDQDPEIEDDRMCLFTCNAQWFILVRHWLGKLNAGMAYPRYSTPPSLSTGMSKSQVMEGPQFFGISVVLRLEGVW